MATPVWEKQSEFSDPTWYLIYETGFYVCQRTAAGDWCGGWNPEDDPCITDETFDYRDTLPQMRKYCEGLLCHIPEVEHQCN